jgi:hypothetical protein
MRIPAAFCVLTVAAAFSISIAGASAAEEKKPVFVEPGFQFESVDTVYVLPAVDIRIKKDQNAEAALQTIDSGVLYYLKKRGYRTVPEDPKHGGFSQSAFSKVSHKEEQTVPPVRMTVSEDDLKEPDEQWVRKLGPDNARWVLVLALEDSESHLTFGSTGSAIVMGTLFDKQNGNLVWRGIGAGRAGQGGVLGMATKSESVHDAVQSAIEELCSIVAKRK